MNTLDLLDESNRKKIEAIRETKELIFDQINKLEIPIPMAIAALLDGLLDCYVQLGVRNKLSLSKIKETVFLRLIKSKELEWAIEEAYKEAKEKINSSI